jgi:3'-5' exoribonuclease
MPPTRRPLPKLAELEPGEHADFFVQLGEKTAKTTRDGKPFYSCRFRDAKRTAAVVVWSDGPFFDDCRKHWQPGAYFKVRARFDVHDKYGPQLDLEQLRPVEDRDRADGFAEADFAVPSRTDPDRTLADLLALAGELADAPLRQLVLDVLRANTDRLKLLPGSPTKYHVYPGGWLDHTLAVARHSLLLADRYLALYPDLVPKLNRDLVLAGAILHDIGRARELDPATLPRPTVDGELFGHLLLGVELIRHAAAGVEGLNPEVLRLLEHVVYTHLRIPEWGSPKLPAIPEVLIVHHADDLDAKFEMYARCLSRDESDGPFTDRDPALGRPLLKRRSV